MKILITGCCGFIGSHLAEALLKNNQEVIGIDLSSDSIAKESNLEILQNYSNFTFVQESVCMSPIIKIHQPTIVVHLSEPVEVSEKYIHNNIFGHTYLLNESIKNNVQRFIYASSSSVYENHSTDKPCLETDFIENTENMYTTCEKITEILAKTTKTECVGVRLFSVYGPRASPDMAPLKFCDAILKGKPIELYGNGTQKRDYTYIEDVVECLVRMVLHTKPISGIYNIGYGNPVSILQLIDYLEEFIQVTGKICHKPASNMDINTIYCKHANSKFKKEFNFAPQISCRDGIKKMVDWVIQQHKN
jgi:UDP-glucuronate 4-epimerase